VVRFSDQPFIYFLSPKLLLKRNGKPGRKNDIQYFCDEHGETARNGRDFES